MAIISVVLNVWFACACTMNLNLPSKLPSTESILTYLISARMESLKMMSQSCLCRMEFWSLLKIELLANMQRGHHQWSNSTVSWIEEKARTNVISKKGSTLLWTKWIILTGSACPTFIKTIVIFLRPLRKISRLFTKICGARTWTIKKN